MKNISENKKAILRKQYNNNESKNYHSENYLLLAKNFGTKKEVEKVKTIIARNKKRSYTSSEDMEWMYNNIHKKYIGELF